MPAGSFPDFAKKALCLREGFLFFRKEVLKSVDFPFSLPAKEWRKFCELFH